VGRKRNDRSLSVWWIKLAEGTSELRVPRGLQIHTGTENVFIGVIAINCSVSQSVSCSPGVSVVLRNEGLIQRGTLQVRACVSRHVLNCFGDYEKSFRSHFSDAD